MKRITEKIIALALVLNLCISALAVGASAGVDTSEFSPQSDEMTIAVVNYDSVWGDVDANIEKMTEYIEAAAEQGVEFILFPEMAVTGYCSSSSSDSAVYQTAISTAESADGETATYFAQLAVEYDMWICYGGTETVEGDDEHAYNSVFACSPDGEVITYQKIHPVEGTWCVSGSTPVMLDTQWGNIGISICYDTYAVPELERYYVANGCRMILNPTATSRGSYTAEDGTLNTDAWRWYYEDRLESISDRDGIYIASCDLTGSEYDADGNVLYTFPGGSCVLGPGGSAESGKYTAYYAGSTDWQEAGMAYATVDLSKVYSVSEDGIAVSSTASDILTSANFAPSLYSSWYSDLASEGFEMAAAPVESEAVISVVNFDAVWGDLDANLEKMLDYIDTAADNGTNIIVFPEMALNGYCSSSDPTSEVYRLAVDTAITTDGEYAQAISAAAVEYNMYIVFGASEQIPDEIKGDADQAYNSAFCCCPSGEVVSYQKIQPVEGGWCMAGDTPVIVETPYGALGLSICKDTYSYPELSRYYVAKGCTYIVNPTATSRGGEMRWSWYYRTRLESTCDRDKVVIISADLCGTEYASDGSALYTFPGGSCVMADLRSADNGSYISYIAGTGEYEPNAAGMYTGTLDLTSNSYSITYGGSISYFQPELYSEWYASLTDEVSDSVAFIAALASADADTSGSSSGSGSASSSTHSGSSSSGTATTTTTTVTDVTDTAFNTTPIEVTTEAVMTEEEAAAAVAAMTDVEADAYYADAIAWALEYGITTGTSDSTFDPSAECTRAQIVTFLYRMAGSPTIEGGTNIFADVDSDAYYYDAILWAIENGITNGTSSTTFDPDAVCTRAQIATFLHRFAGQPEADDHGFVDVDSDDYYNSAVAWAYENGITTGTSDSTFSPADDCTRAQVVTFLYRYVVE